MNKIDVNSSGLYDLGGEALPSSLKQKAKQCIEMQKSVAEKINNYRENPKAASYVDEPALNAILDSKQDVHGVSTQRDISNVICFGAGNIDDAIHNQQIQQLREQVDSEVESCLAQIFQQPRPGKVVSSGHFWYPKHSFMGWHTNSQAPGWRIYINYAETEGDSFFRYRVPDSGEVVTLSDRTWNMRIFRVTQEEQFWHCVYSKTNRFSLGYMLKVEPPKSKLRRLFGIFSS